MTNLYKVDAGKSASWNLDDAFRGIGVTLSEKKYGSEYSADGVRAKATHEHWSLHPRFTGIRLWVEDARYTKIIRRVLVKDGTLDLDKLMLRFAELRAMVPGIERQKEEGQKALELDLESRDQAKVEREALAEEIGKLVHIGDFDIRRSRMEDAYILTLRSLTADDVRWLAALKRELVGWR